MWNRSINSIKPASTPQMFQQACHLQAASYNPLGWLILAAGRGIQQAWRIHPGMSWEKQQVRHHQHTFRHVLSFPETLRALMFGEEETGFSRLPQKGVGDPAVLNLAQPAHNCSTSRLGYPDTGSITAISVWVLCLAYRSWFVALLFNCYLRKIKEGKRNPATPASNHQVCPNTTSLLSSHIPQ